MATLLWMALGLVFLVLGAEALVRGASRLATLVGISPLVVGLTVVAFGTSAPELAVSVQSALDGQAGIAVGNVVGSNIFNVLFILGISALIVPLAVSQQLVRLDVPLMIGISLLVLVLGWDGRLSPLEGALLFAGIVSYTVFLVVQSRKESKAIEQEYEQEFGAKEENTPLTWARNLLFIVAGLALLIMGSRLLVEGAIEIAHYFGVSDLVIGLTIVAAGTSLPEVVTSIVAALRGERDIAVGNVVGSNIFNILCVLGLTSMVAPGGLEVSETALRFDIPVMIAVALACLPIFFTGYTIARWEGALFLAYYVAYTVWLILSATSSTLQGSFLAAMTGFVLPLTAITLVVLAVRAWRAGRQ
ncbi:calcium/sodium antiporter [Aeromonas diversa]|uniref:CaCA family Na(+)/Ca(+) antiporter n=1 Tax=Aeromonas diversa CDC 2478-85 TaxID=1268237 RepID=N9VLF1_9GAMM|nr:calcium/sodium antiporter [Aeromonas diversa]ENY72156.1 CaCA family Na(+)/Ca(+) antiporter [Aeromonas diversa CDC 2478-85]